MHVAFDSCNLLPLNYFTFSVLVEVKGILANQFVCEKFSNYIHFCLIIALFFNLV